MADEHLSHPARSILQQQSFYETLPQPMADLFLESLPGHAAVARRLLQLACLKKILSVTSLAEATLTASIFSILLRWA